MESIDERRRRFTAGTSFRILRTSAPSVGVLGQVPAP